MRYISECLMTGIKDGDRACQTVPARHITAQRPRRDDDFFTYSQIFLLHRELLHCFQLHEFHCANVFE